MDASENREAAFIAEITASTTHEIRNVLAIVKESAGLIEDLTHSFNRRGSLDHDKLVRALGRIDAQVGRGAELLSNLNRFAHSLDHAEEQVDLNQEVQQVAFLSKGFARRRRHLLELQLCGQSTSILLSPFRLQMALFTAVQCCLEQLPEGSKLVMSTDRRAGRATVEFASLGDDESAPIVPAEAPRWSELLRLLQGLAASAELTPQRYGFRLIFPVTGTG